MVTRVFQVVIAVLVFPYFFAKSLFREQEWDVALGGVAVMGMFILLALFLLPFSVPAIVSKAGIALFVICALICTVVFDDGVMLNREQRRTNQLLEEIKNQRATIKGDENK